MEIKKFLTAAEVADEFGLNAKDLQQFVDSGAVRALADRGTWKYRRDELESLVESGKIVIPLMELSESGGLPTPGEILKIDDDEMSYIELDEEALAEHATIISKSSPLSKQPVAESTDESTFPDDWFSSDKQPHQDVAHADPAQSSSDVRAYTGPDADHLAASALEKPVISVDDSNVLRAEDLISDDSSNVKLVEGDSNVRLSDPWSDPEQPVASLADSDSDVRIAPAAPVSKNIAGSKMGVRPDSDSDVRLSEILSDAEHPIASLADSDSDVRISPVTPVASKLSTSIHNIDEEVVVSRPDSDSDVRLAGSLSDAERPVAGLADSDSDVRIADVAAPGFSDSGIALDFDVGSGVTATSSGSSVRLPQTDAYIGARSEDPSQVTDEFDWDIRNIADAPIPGESGLNLGAGSSSAAQSGVSSTAGVASNVMALNSDSGWKMSPGESGIALEAAGLSGYAPTGESGPASGANLLAGESGLDLDGGDSRLALEPPGSDDELKLHGENSGIILPADVVAGQVAPGSAVGLPRTLGNLADDSGINVEPYQAAETVLEADVVGQADDSGISLFAEDSGISLQATDSGISLEANDSGLTLENADDSGISVSPMDQTLADDFDLDGALKSEGDQFGATQTLDLSSAMDDDSAFDMNLGSSSDLTSEVLIDEDDDVDYTAQTVVHKGRSKASPQVPGLTEAFKLDDGPPVEDLDISDDLDSSSFAGVDDEIAVDDDEEILSVEDEGDEELEEVFEASDESFSGEVEEASDDYLTPMAVGAGAAAAAAAALKAREPKWGAVSVLGLLACAGLLLVNSLVLWGGVVTMWNGADAPSPVAGIISQIGSML